MSPDELALYRAAQVCRGYLYEDARDAPPPTEAERSGPFGQVIATFEDFHKQAAELSANTGKLYDVWADTRSVWEGMRSSDDGTNQYGLLDQEIRRIVTLSAGVDLRTNGHHQELIPNGDAPLATKADPIPHLNPISGDDLMAMSIPPPRQFVEGLIREGLSFFIGQPGVGKTPALVQYAISLATGGKWLGVFPVPKVRVAYIGPEYDRGDIRNIIMESTGGQASLKNLLLFTIENFSAPRSEEEALEMIDKLVMQYRIEAAVIDLFTGFLPPEKFKPNAYRGDYREFLAYHKVALGHHIAMTGAWHGTKRDTNPATMYNGGQGFWGAAGGGRLVMYQDDEDQVKLWAQLRGNKPIAYSLSESWIGGCRTWAVLEGSIPEPTFGSDIHRVIYRMIREHAPSHGLPPKTIASLVRPELTTNVREEYIRKCINVLHKRGLLRAIGDGYVVSINGGSKGSEGSGLRQGSEGSEGSEADCTDFAQDFAQDVSRFRSSDPSPIPEPIPGSFASESPEPASDPSDPQLSPIPEIFRAIPRDRLLTLNICLKSSQPQYQDKARAICQEFNVDYEQARKEVQQ